jgi:hypothetical protein
MSQTFNINNIYANLNRYGGLLHPCNFLLIIQPPKFIRNFTAEGITADLSHISATVPKDKQQSVINSNFFNSIPFFCFNTTVPGMNYTTTPIRRHGYGPIENRPSDVLFPDVFASFMCDSEGNVVNFFHSWLQNINNFEDSFGTRRSVSGAVAFEFQFPDNYETQIQIIQYNPIGNSVIEYTLKEAYPSAIVELPLDWGATDIFSTLSVNFKYKTWTSRALDPGTFATTSLTYRNILTDPIAAAIYAYNTIQSPELLADFIATQLNSLAYIPLRGGIGMNLLTTNITGLI